MSDENQRSAWEIDPSSDDSSSNNSVHHDREHEIHAPRSDRESSFESTQTGFSSTPSAHATGSDQFGMPGQPSGSNQFVDPNQSAGFGQPTGVMQAPRQSPQKTKRFSTPAVAALILAAAVASGAVTGAVVSNRDSGSSSDNSSAVSALKASPAKTKNVDTNGSVQSVAQKVLPSVVSITVEAGNSGDTGSGSIISEDGTIITNNHVIAGAANGGKISVTLNDGTTYPEDIVARDPETDIAVIKAQGASGLTPISLGDSSKLEVGQEVVAVGSPLGLDATVTSGIISAQNRPVQASSESSDQSTLIDAIQTDAAINPGNSGGALVDMDGNLIGIPSVIASLGSSSMSQGSGSIGLGFAIPINQARDIAEQLIKNGKVQHPVIGVQVAKESTAHGAVIVDVPSDSDAAKAGLKRGDVVTKVDGRTIDSGLSLIAAIRSHKVGDTVKMEVTNQDGKDAREITMTLSSQETSGE